MKLIKSSYEILTPIHKSEILTNIEFIGRVCYKSEANITSNSATKFVEMLIKRGHEAIIEHHNITVKFICDRGISHEIVRHRVASYAQESTRYCNYSKDEFKGELTFIVPSDFESWHPIAREQFKLAMNYAEDLYLKYIDIGMTPQQARAILPNALKTELVMTANLREWRHFFNLRTAKTAHPDIRALTISLLNDLKIKLPVIFDDI